MFCPDRHFPEKAWLPSYGTPNMAQNEKKICKFYGNFIGFEESY